METPKDVLMETPKDVLMETPKEVLMEMPKEVLTETSIEALYKETLEAKMKIEVCYKVIKENYMNYRIEAYNESKKSLLEIKKTLENFSKSVNINAVFQEYKELLLKFIMYKKKIQLLIESTQPLLKPKDIELMVKEQEQMLGFVDQIHNRFPKEKISELHDFIKTEINKK